MFKHTVICPLCFEKVNVSDIGFKCCSPTCRSSSEFFRVQAEIPLLEKLGVLSAPKRMQHTCGEMAAARICPNCKQEIPSEIEDITDLRITIIGVHEVGKSVYVTMLIHWIKCMEAKFGWRLIALTKSTISQYGVFHDRLFKRHELLYASHVICDTYRHAPLVYVLHLGKGMLAKRIMLVFLDVPGENLNNQAFLPHVSRYICNASGIICIVDPLQIGSIRKTIAAKYGEDVLPMPEIDSCGVIMGRIVDAIKENTHCGKQIKIPLAVAFSKMDFVREAGENTAGVCDELFRETRHHGAFCEAEFKKIDGLMRSWVQEVDVSASILAQSEIFEKNAFFGFSALGCNPKGNGERLDRDPRSFRVEDPFLWLLRQKKLIKTIKG